MAETEKRKLPSPELSEDNEDTTKGECNKNRNKKKKCDDTAGDSAPDDGKIYAIFDAGRWCSLRGFSTSIEGITRLLGKCEANPGSPSAFVIAIPQDTIISKPDYPWAREHEVDIKKKN